MSQHTSCPGNSEEHEAELAAGLHPNILPVTRGSCWGPVLLWVAGEGLQLHSSHPAGEKGPRPAAHLPLGAALGWVMGCASKSLINWRQCESHVPGPHRRICSVVICAQIKIIKYENSFLLVNPKKPKSSKEAHLGTIQTHLCAQLWLHLPKRVRNALWIPGL